MDSWNKKFRIVSMVVIKDLNKIWVKDSLTHFNECNQKFAQKTNLNKHMKTHLNCLIFCYFFSIEKTLLIIIIKEIKHLNVFIMNANKSLLSYRIWRNVWKSIKK
jgi:hypothetical protein